MTNVVSIVNRLPPRPQPPRDIAHFLRVGSNHRLLETLLESDRLPVSRFVVGAGVAATQGELIQALRQNGHEIALDTNVAELSVVGRFKGTSGGAPWADPDRPLQPSHFMTDDSHDVVRKIADYVVNNKFDRVLAPTHLLSGHDDPWFALDVWACNRLRRLLDDRGATSVPIDYPLILKRSVYEDPIQRNALKQSLSTASIASIWLRVSGFGAASTGVAAKKYIVSACDLQQLDKPLIADGAGGIISSGLLAFGAVSGICHGLAEQERFDASGWHKPPVKGGGGGYTILVPGLDRLFKKADAEILMNVAGARNVLSCRNPQCCRFGFDDTIRNPKAHYISVRSKSIADLMKVPEGRRPRHFIEGELKSIRNDARRASKLAIGQEALSAVVKRSVDRIDRVYDVLTSLANAGFVSEKALALPRRVAPEGLRREQP